MSGFRLTRRIAGRGPGEWEFADELRAICCDGTERWLLVGDLEVTVLTRDILTRQRNLTERTKNFAEDH